MSTYSCFLLALCVIMGKAQLDSEYSGYAKAPGNCPGSPISEQHVDSGHACAELCNHDENCKGFTIGNNPVDSSSQKMLCLLKSEVCESPQASNEFTFHSKQTKHAIVPGPGGYYEVREDLPGYPWYPPPPPPPPPAPAPAPAPYYAPAFGGYYYGNVAGFTRANGNCQGNFLSGVLGLPIEQCAAQCMATPSCAGFSFNFHAPFPQCILKAASCPFPDPSAVFTFFARNGMQPPYPYPYYPEVPVPEYLPPMLGAPWTKSARRFFKESSELCSGRILKGPQDLDLDKCADACLNNPECTGFSFDNYAKSSPYSCTLRAEACQARSNSTRWSYFERQQSQSNYGSGRTREQLIDQAYLHALETAIAPHLTHHHGQQNEIGKTKQHFFDIHSFMHRPMSGSPAHHHILVEDDMRRR